MVDHSTMTTVLATAACLEIVRWAVRKFLSKAIDTEYITVEQCRVCRETCKVNRAEKNDELLKNIRLLRAEMRGLRVAFLKHMVHSDEVPKEAIDAVLDKLDNIEKSDEALAG